MKFGLLVPERKVSVVQGFIDANSTYGLEVVRVGGNTFIAFTEDFESLDAPGAVEVVRQMINVLGHINDVAKSVSVIDTKTNTAEDHIEHIRRLHRERAAASKPFSLEGMRRQGGLDQEFDQGTDH